MKNGQKEKNVKKCMNDTNTLHVHGSRYKETQSEVNYTCWNNFVRVQHWKWCTYNVYT